MRGGGGGAPFKIALFADLHFGEDAWTEWGPRQDLNSLRVMSSVVDTEQPGVCVCVCVCCICSYIVEKVKYFLRYQIIA